MMARRSDGVDTVRTSRTLRSGGRVRQICIALVMTLASAVHAQTTLDDATQAFAEKVLVALRESDHDALEALFDAPTSMAELDMLGLAPKAWDDLDKIGRRGHVLTMTKAWVRNEPRFHRDALVQSTERLEDPNEGMGVLPERLVLRARLRNLRSNEQRDVIIVGTPEHRVLDIQFGKLIPEESAATAALLEAAQWSTREPRSPIWFEDVALYERDDMRALILEFEEAATPQEQAELAEELHRDPHISVSALLERLIELDRLEVGPSETKSALFAIVSRITGRAAPGGVTGQGHDELIAWLRWQQNFGLEFEPAPIEAPIAPNRDEILAGADDDSEGSYDGWQEALAKRRAEEAEALAKSADKGAASEPATDSPATEPPAASEPAPAPWQPPTKKVAGLDTAAPTSKTVLRVTLSDAAAGLDVRRGGKVATAKALEADLSTEQIKVLNTWADFIEEHRLLVVVGHAPALVISATSESIADQASKIMDDAHRLIDGVVPLVDGRDPGPVTAFMIDYERHRDNLQIDLVAKLIEHGDLDERSLDTMREDPASLMMRGLPGFIQFTWDMAGDASAGDDEFRVANEVANKYTQCLVTTRLGPTPDTLRWGLGFVAEMALFKSVYMFNATGFVSSGDHFDWHTRTRQYLEKRRSAWSFGDDMLDEEVAGTAEGSQMITWGGLEYLRAEHPDRLATLLGDLGEAQRNASKWSTVFRVPFEEVDALIDKAFDGIEKKKVLTYLKEARG